MDIQIIDCPPQYGDTQKEQAKKSAPLSDRSARSPSFSQPHPNPDIMIPNIDLAYFSTLLRQEGHHVFMTGARPEKADFHFIPVTLQNWQEALALGKRLKEKNSGKLAFMGTIVTAHPDYFKDTADYLFHGEIEKLILDWGLSELTEQSVHCGYVHDLEVLPFPDWDLFPLKKFKLPAVSRKGPVLPVQTSRGCPYRCTVCPSRVNCDFRMRSPAHVCEEIDFLHGKYDIDGFVLMDPNFAISDSRLFEFCELLIARGFDLRFGLRSHANCFTPMVLEKLGPTGLCHLELEIHPQAGCYGGENLLEDELPEHLRKILEICRGMGITVVLYYLLDATRLVDEDYDKVIHMEESLKPDDSFVMMLSPFSGSPGGENGETESANDRVSTFLNYHARPFAVHMLRQKPFLSYCATFREFGKLKKLYNQFFERGLKTPPTNNGST